MPTNRKRVARKSNRIPLTFTDEFIEHLKAADFLGELTLEEIPIAKELNIFCWDEWMKKERGFYANDKT